MALFDRERGAGFVRFKCLMRWIFVGAATLVGVGLAGCSGAATSTTAPTSATSTSAPPPAGWKTVTYDGVGIDVPNDWLVEPWRATCGVTAPTVFIGPAQPSAMSCEASPPAGAEVILGALPTNGLKMVVTNLNGLKALLATQDEPDAGNLGVTITTIWVSLPTKDVEISVSVGDSSIVPGGAPERAEEIVQSIHQVTNHG